MTLCALVFVGYSGLQNVMFADVETISGTPSWHIRGTKTVTNSGSVGSGTVVRTEDLWFRQSDYYRVKIAIADNASASFGWTGGCNVCLDGR